MLALGTCRMVAVRVEHLIAHPDMLEGKASAAPITFHSALLKRVVKFGSRDQPGGGGFGSGRLLESRDG